MKKHIGAFLVFGSVISFVVTCSFLLFFHDMELEEDAVRNIAPVVFGNIFVLSALFVIFDAVRQKLTVERPVKEIQKGLDRLMEGDFQARIDTDYFTGKDNPFKVIAKNLNLLAEELSSVETLRNDFVANVSHELKTPLAVMQNYGTMLQQPGLSEEERLDYAKSITDVSGRLAGLITNILKLNKLENQQIFPATEVYDLSEQLCQCLLNFEDIWEEKEIEIEADIEDGVRICSDQELLSLVWNNLMSNALKFTEPGGKVSVSLKCDANQVNVTIRDTGCGMTPEIGQHIFEKFYQGDTSHATKGNGLGLALVKRVVDIIQGEVHVESILGEGSTFTVTIDKGDIH